ncbi:hypothetical protein [Streptomyces sp. SBT349]|uniref:hypothetical protein n=1 Tax=Streptomyces sp. SBT349 TaxID=1580539 RepID=UPI00069F75AE|nr:hypothetical protein [Streptomyces sp. SBT349]
MPVERRFEINIGLYATGEDAARIAEGCRRLLDGGTLPYELALGERPPGDGLYEELPEQWRAQYPGTAPGSRAVHEITVGVVTSRERMDALRASLTRTICPDPDHASPCPVPWSSHGAELPARPPRARPADRRR